MNQSDEDTIAFYPESFHISRERFLIRAQELQAQIFSHPIVTKTPELRDKLHLDIAVLGSLQAPHVIIHIAGTHGVEGFVGAAIQSAILRHANQLPPTTAVVLVHCLNPWGMAMLRRTNEENVDLNRNSVIAPHLYAGIPEGYHLVKDLLLPRSRSLFPLFALLVAGKIARHGFPSLKKVVLAGQYEEPQGLYFGGKELQPELIALRDWLACHLKKTKQVVSIDVHSGLGAYGEDYLLLDYPQDSEQHIRATKLFGASRVQSDSPSSSVASKTSGALSHLITNALGNASVDCVVHEFGTFHPIRVLHALVEENRRFTSTNGSSTTSPDVLLKEVFCPPDPNWRRRTVKRGVSIFTTAATSFS